MISLHANDTISRTDWEQFLSDYGDKSIFHSADWLGAMTACQGGTLREIGIYDQQDLVGIVPLITKRFGPIRVAASPFVIEDTPYLGILVKNGRIEAALAALASYQDISRIHFLRLLQREYCQEDASNYSGFTLIQKQTHLLDLTQTEEEIWKGMEGRCRTAIRKAEKYGICVSRADSSDSIEIYYEMLDALYHRQGFKTPNTCGFYRDLWGKFNGRGLSLLLATIDDKVIAGAMFLHCSDRFYYLNGTSKPEHNALCPNNMIQWAAIKYAKSCGARVYDFVGSDIPRLAKFKKSFGGRLATYTCLERSSAKWVTLVRDNFPLYKRIIGKASRIFGKH